MGTDCKSAAFQLRWFESTRAHQKSSSVEIHWSFLFYPASQASLLRVDLNSIDPPNRPAGKKAPVQQRRPLPVAETGRSCWGCGQQDACAAQGTMQPLGAATRAPYSARLAQSTRAHQEMTPRNACFWVFFFCANPLFRPQEQKERLHRFCCAAAPSVMPSQWRYARRSRTSAHVSMPMTPLSSAI